LVVAVAAGRWWAAWVTRRSPGSRGTCGVAEAGLPGQDDGLGAVGDVELEEDVRDVVADGLLAEEEGGGDLGVAAALGDEFEDLAFAFGELGKGGLARVGHLGEVGQHPAGDLGA